MAYKWDDPVDWLLSKNWPDDCLWGVIQALVTKVSPDDIQELFQNEMEEDGYFKKLR